MIIHNLNYPENINQPSTAIFVGDDYVTWDDINDKVSEWREECNIINENIYIIGSTEFYEYLKTNEDIDSTAYQRIHFNQNVNVFTYNNNGKIFLRKSKHEIIPAETLLLDLIVKLANEFAKILRIKSDLVTPAPLGFYYKKQSGRVSSHFIRGGNLLTSSTTIDLYSLCLQSRFDFYCTQHKGSRIRILIDTMSIWPIANKLLINRLATDKEKRIYIESFRSYEGIDSENLLSDEASFVIISASTSDGLKKEILKIIKNESSFFTTLLYLDGMCKIPKFDITSKDLFLFKIPVILENGNASLNGLRSEFKSNIDALPLGSNYVDMVSENFLTKSSQPVKIRLVHTALNDDLKVDLANLANSRMTISALRKDNLSEFWPVSFNVESLINYLESQIINWIRNNGSPGDLTIIHSDGADGLLFAEKVKSIFLGLSSASQVNLISYSSLKTISSSKNKPPTIESSIVCIPIIGNGFIFKLISAYLRGLQPTGPRLYLCLLALPESFEHWNDLKKDLTVNAEDSLYKFKYGFSFTVGKVEQTVSFHHELTFLQKLEAFCEKSSIDFPNFLTKRVNGLLNGTGLDSDNTFLRTTESMPLSLSTGFMLWNRQSDHNLQGADLAPSILLTISTYLQQCRSGLPTIRSENSLATNIFQQRLIAPGTFTRFNDPLIQAAILRCAYDTELDYSSSTMMSSEMRSIILRYTELADLKIGSALAEFLYALHTGRIKLTTNDYLIIRKRCAQLPGWLSLILEISNN